MFGRFRRSSQSPPAAASALNASTLAETVAEHLVDSLLPDELDTYHEWSHELQAWAVTSLAFLAFFAIIHASVRVVGKYGRPHDERSSLPIRALWATLFAIFPEARPRSRPAQSFATLARAASLTTKLKKDAKSASADSTSTLRAMVSTVVRSIDLAIAFIFLDLAIAVVAPVAVGLHMMPFQVAGQVTLSILLAARVVAPLGQSLHDSTDAVISSWEATTKGEHDFDHLRSGPDLIQGALWLVWMCFLGSTLGFDVRVVLSSLGASGFFLALALQHYAADVVGGFTLIADGRFSYGDQITIGGAPNWTVTVRQVGLLVTRCAKLDGPACTIPNSVLVRASIINESRVKSRRIPIDVVVDGATAPAKLAELPSALLSAARRALAAQKATDVTFTYEALGNAADLVDISGPHGVQMQLVLNVPTLAADVGRWKRLKSCVMLAVLGELSTRQISLGRTAQRVTHEGSGVPWG